jgi:hypothetical protein
MVSAEGKNMPVLLSPVGLIDGAAVVPAEITIPLENVETPEELKVLLPILIVPD